MTVRGLRRHSRAPLAAVLAVLALSGCRFAPPADTVECSKVLNLHLLERHGPGEVVSYDRARAAEDITVTLHYVSEDAPDQLRSLTCWFHTGMQGLKLVTLEGDPADPLDANTIREARAVIGKPETPWVRFK